MTFCWGHTHTYFYISFTCNSIDVVIIIFSGSITISLFSAALFLIYVGWLKVDLTWSLLHTTLTQHMMTSCVVNKGEWHSSITVFILMMMKCHYNTTGLHYLESNVLYQFTLISFYAKSRVFFSPIQCIIIFYLFISVVKKIDGDLFPISFSGHIAQHIF